MNKFLILFFLISFSINSFALYDCNDIGSPCTGPTFGDGTIQQCISDPAHCCCQSIASIISDDSNQSIEEKIHLNEETFENKVYLLK